jgi:uncharacterized protein (TIGR02246 family)
MNRSAVGCLLAASLMLTACKTHPSKAEAEQAIRAKQAQLNQDYASKDAEKVTAHYADDAVLAIPGAPAIKGKPAIHQAIKQMETDPALRVTWRPERIEVADSGDLAFVEGSYHLTMTDPSTKDVISDHGTYLTTYRLGSDGDWKIAADMSTSEPPAETAEGSAPAGAGTMGPIPGPETPAAAQSDAAQKAAAEGSTAKQPASAAHSPQL